MFSLYKVVLKQIYCKYLRKPNPPTNKAIYYLKKRNMKNENLKFGDSYSAIKGEKRG